VISSGVKTWTGTPQAVMPRVPSGLREKSVEVTRIPTRASTDGIARGWPTWTGRSTA